MLSERFAGLLPWALRRLALPGLVCIGVLAIFPHLLAQDLVLLLLLEDGIIESAAVALWIGAALAALARRVPPTTLMCAYAVSFAALAAREADWFRRLPVAGKQLLRWSYYLGDAPPMQRLAMAALVGALLVALLVALWGSLRNLRRADELPWPAVRLLIAAVFVLALSQLCEKGVDWVEVWPALAPRLARSLWSLEEGLEALAPLLVLLAMLCRRRRDDA